VASSEGSHVCSGNRTEGLRGVDHELHDDCVRDSRDWLRRRAPTDARASIARAAGPPGPTPGDERGSATSLRDRRAPVSRRRS
jgi:hypothetical protein